MAPLPTIREKAKVQITLEKSEKQRFMKMVDELQRVDNQVTERSAFLYLLDLYSKYGQQETTNNRQSGQSVPTATVKVKKKALVYLTNSESKSDGSSFEESTRNLPEEQQPKSSGFSLNSQDITRSESYIDETPAWIKQEIHSDNEEVSDAPTIPTKRAMKRNHSHQTKPMEKAKKSNLRMKNGQNRKKKVEQNHTNHPNATPDQMQPSPSLNVNSAENATDLLRHVSETNGESYSLWRFDDKFCFRRT